MLKFELEERVAELEDTLEAILDELDHEEPDLDKIQAVAEDALGELDEEIEEVVNEPV